MTRYLPFLFVFISLPALAQLNAVERSNVDFGVGINDVWGYVSPDGTEYALVGLDTGVAIVSLADPDAAEVVGVASGVRSVWRDMKTYGEYAYVVSDQRDDGLTVIDLRQLPDTFAVTHVRDTVPGFNRPFHRAHNLYIDTTRGLAFTSGGDGNINAGGILIFDLKANPLHPPIIARGPAIYSHDVYVQDNLMYASEIVQGELAIYDTKDLNNIRELGRVRTPTTFTHNAWTNTTGSTVFTTDEKPNASVAAYDITDPSAIELLDEYRPLSSLNSGTIPHNVHVIDNFLSVSYYTDGLRVVDASVPTNLIEVANYDTWVGPNGDFNGAWGAYPFLPSGLTLVSDRQSGLYVIDVNYVRAARLEGMVVDSVTGVGINNASVAILTDQLNATLSDPLGAFATGIARAGTYSVAVSAEGYVSDTISVDLANDSISALTVELARPQDQSTATGDPGPAEIEVVLAPNPAPGAAVLRYNLGRLTSGSVRLYTATGTLVSEQRLSRSEGSIEVADGFPSGVYILHLTAGGKSLRTLQLVKL
ncbi:choice-of-anchor B domain-containing protein [Neolewinella xylanilytica]|uniref:Choice-of-anchor B domain-containing protein n=1 Tax=Neolewinella xylanilytica TaxID=1514080 RepID=A0A2S6I5I3_9BACT|nr:choice-of-anchor B family protein [Neolewinella xylanilytica]PPK86410.1 choice-of-anchor B domain-containing protein [Neolewinella xylanilytica]